MYSVIICYIYSSGRVVICKKGFIDGLLIVIVYLDLIMMIIIDHDGSNSL
jgi:hypothetical protein